MRRCVGQICYYDEGAPVVPLLDNGCYWFYLALDSITIWAIDGIFGVSLHEGR